MYLNPARTATFAPPEGDEAQAERRLKGGEVKPDDLLKVEVTKLPNAHDAKVNLRWRRRWRKRGRKRLGPSSPPPTTEASSAVFRTPITHCRATRASLLARPLLSPSQLRNLILRAPTHNKNQSQATTQQNKTKQSACLCALSHSKYKDFLAKLEDFW